MNDQSHSIGISLGGTPERDKILAERGFHAAYAAWEPTPEERQAQAEAFRELGRKAAEHVDELVMKALTGK